VTITFGITQETIVSFSSVVKIKMDRKFLPGRSRPGRRHEWEMTSPKMRIDKATTKGINYCRAHVFSEGHCQRVGLGGILLD
jgi:hypothetical protein